MFRNINGNNIYALIRNQIIEWNLGLFRKLDFDYNISSLSPISQRTCLKYNYGNFCGLK